MTFRDLRQSFLESWTGRHQVLLAGIFIVLNALGFLIDLFMVMVLKVDSISWRTWVAEELHPTISVAGTLGTIAACWLVRTEWRLVMLAAFVGGHLFAHT